MPIYAIFERYTRSVGENALLEEKLHALSGDYKALLCDHESLVSMINQREFLLSDKVDDQLSCIMHIIHYNIIS